VPADVTTVYQNVTSPGVIGDEEQQQQQLQQQQQQQQLEETERMEHHLYRHRHHYRDADQSDVDVLPSSRPQCTSLCCYLPQL